MAVQITFKPKFKKLMDGLCFGANIMEGSERNLAAMIPLAKGLFPVYYYNLISGIKNETGADQVISFLKEVGAKLGIFLPISKKVAPDYMDWLVKKFEGYIVFIQLDAESMSNPAGMTSPEYVTDAKAQMKRYPLLTYSWDLGRFARYPNKAHVERNEEIAKQAAPPYEGNLYAQMVDLIKGAGGIGFGRDQLANVELIKNCIAVLCPQYFIDDFRKYTPNLKRLNILQFFLENAGENFLSGAVSNYGISEFLRFTLTNPDIFSRIFWMQVAGLMGNGKATPEYNTIKRVIPATKFKYSVPLDIVPIGVTGQGFWDGSNSYGLLLDNATATEPPLAAGDIKISGKVVSGNLRNDFGSGTSWSSAAPLNGIDLNSKAIRMFGPNFITFTTRAA